MSFFESTASQWFMTAPDGRRLLCLNGPFSKPYLIPDPATEIRLCEKVANLNRLLFWMVVGGALAVGAFVPDSWPRGPVVLVAALLAAAIAKLSTLSVTKNLTRAPTRVPLSRYYGSIARHRSWAGVWTGLVFACLFVAVAAFMLRGDKPLAGAIGLAVFGPVALMWGYIIKRKLEMEASERV